MRPIAVEAGGIAAAAAGGVAGVVFGTVRVVPGDSGVAPARFTVLAT